MFKGLEIDMLNLGDADCLLVSRWNGPQATRTLIDAGNASDFPTVRTFLRALGVAHLDAVVSTHPHNDHVAGLIELVNDRSISIGQAFVHVPQDHVRMPFVERALKEAKDSGEARSFQKTLEASRTLLNALAMRRILVTEPFQGTIVGPFTVVGPSASYYGQLMGKFEDAALIKAIDQGDLSYRIDTAIEEAMIKSGMAESVELLDDPQTTPENNSSVILGTVAEEKKFLLTSDAGAPALKLALAAYDLSGCYWMQIPHHGSRRNITVGLIEHFSPQVAFVSASGNIKHPRRSVVNAFKKCRANVYSTHYPKPANLRSHVGTVPARLGYVTATPLYEESGTQEKRMAAIAGR